MRAAALGMVLLCGIAQGAEPNSIGMELIEIPAGTFTMGSPAGEKDHKADQEQVTVTLTKPFGLGKTEVTQGQWQQVMGTELWKGKPFALADKDCPATYVSFFDAAEFCEKLTDLERKAGKLKANEEYRLPTEAEWEYACRAGTETAFSFGDESKLNSHVWWGGFDLEELSKSGNFEAGPGNAGREQYAHAVGMKKPNPWGLHDMHGNVAEWCSDWYGEKLSGGTDPVGPNGGSKRLTRGGSWWLVPITCRSAFRSSDDPLLRLFGLGFRVARTQSDTVAEQRQQGSQAEPAPPVAEAKRPVQLDVKSNSIGMELIEIPAGEFTMGQGGGVAVTLTKPFWLGKTEVTQGQWQAVMGTEPWLNKGEVQIGEDNAASYVDWNDATAFCQRLTDLERKAGKLPAGESYRLPTEAQWEYACRAGTTTAYSFGDDEKQLSEYAWFDGNTAGEQYAHAVGLKKPNPWGLHDMHGSVWEWCSDWNNGKLLGGTDPVGPEGGSIRVLRGGGWRLHPDYCRSAYRNYCDPSIRISYLGFRVARSQSAQ